MYVHATYLGSKIQAVVFPLYGANKCTFRTTFFPISGVDKKSSKLVVLVMSRRSRIIHSDLSIPSQTVTV